MPPRDSVHWGLQTLVCRGSGLGEALEVIWANFLCDQMGKRRLGVEQAVLVMEPECRSPASRSSPEILAGLGCWPQSLPLLAWP